MATADASIVDGLRSVKNSYKQWIYLFPALVFYIPLVLLPVLFVLWLSFNSWGGGIEQQYVGLANFESVFSSDVFYTSLWHNIVILGVNLVAHTVGALLLAMALRKAHRRLQPLFQTAILLPMSLMSVAVALIWSLLLNPELGAINAIIAALGIDWQPIWLGDPGLALLSVIFVTNWWWFGFWVVIWLVGLSSIDEKYYEAAAMDGANRLQIFLYVTLPQLKQSAVLVTTLTTINAIRQFGLFWVMTEGGPGRATEVLLTWIYKVAFSINSFGQAAAATVLLFSLILVFTFVNLKLTGAGSEA
ncbi:carbohydrate ABC transporter permease [Halococcus agarilyticus]|uniref:carbohydrate ABC transporter permease n=1 Tax=Halococcus agarilyticus TaxID=1232219 RepID=UPI000677EC1E|nr:sugar ABC transporter permease [Halococcus agarilyticus]